MREPVVERQFLPSGREIPSGYRVCPACEGRTWNQHHDGKHRGDACPRCSGHGYIPKRVCPPDCMMDAVGPCNPGDCIYQVDLV